MTLRDDLLVLNAFLGGPATILRETKLNDISFPFSEMRRVLLPAEYLVRFHSPIENPEWRFFSPDDLFTALSTLVQVERPTVSFHSPASRHPSV